MEVLTISSEESTNGDCPAEKKLNLVDENGSTDTSIHENLKDLSNFAVKEILQNNTNRKVTCLRGSFSSHPGEAVVVLEKPAFSEEILKDYFKGKDNLTKSFHNDIYGDYRYNPSSDLNAVKATVIHPATEKTIQRYTSQKHYMIEESPKIYKDIILPNLAEEEDHLQWVYNILEHKSEADKIVVEDTDPNDGFVMVPDLKWSGELDTLYLLAIVNKKNIKSLRDLTSEHLPLLKNIKEKGSEAIKTKYGIEKHELRVYLHYQPTFYHLHVHFCVLRHEAPGILVGKAHLLSDVISNLEVAPDYYQKSTISFVMPENHRLFEKLKTAGILET
ncbi:unnamed protein product [Acanthoscelides obtectus]|uniref:m7GpppX diphosphatase n=1 Tax=Acanthoscelides obtectus TaxID=200917 RepID=A0A9P0P9J3_ACAOB|nr:unnamed protein product [Acanthoscelides obtectus]CAK1625682.1 m7GpppX diphosphatase [Acanthoscelides obtectus]